jgi:hypothetical protein
MLYVTHMKHVHLPYHTYVTSHCMHTDSHQQTASEKNKMIMARHGFQQTAVNLTHAFRLQYTCRIRTHVQLQRVRAEGATVGYYTHLPSNHSQVSTTTVVIADRMG